MTTEALLSLILKVFISALATVGILEFLKNFIKTSKTWIYSLLMPFISIGCYFACEFLNIAVIGSILTVGTVQLCYQTLVQGFKKVVNAKIGTIAQGAQLSDSDSNESNSNASSDSKDYSAQ